MFGMAAEYTDKLKKKIPQMSPADLYAIIVDASSILYAKHSGPGGINILTRSRDDRLNVDIRVVENPQYNKTFNPETQRWE